MRFFNDLSIRPKLMLSFASVLVLLAVIVATNIILGQQRSTTFNSVIDELVPAKLAALEIASGVRVADDDGAWFVLTPDPEQAAELLATYREDVKQVNAAVERARTLAHTDAQIEALDAFDKFWAGAGGYLAGNEDAFALKQSGKEAEARAAYVSVPFVPSLDAARKYGADVDAA
ncbi:MAG: MCP four helix bundle domain-containing protein, partial [Dehalococcoidia bacterium]